jgi:hypothetical protein
MRPLPLIAFAFTIIAGFCFTACEDAGLLSHDKRKLKVYTIQVKRTDVDYFLQDMDCIKIPQNPCFCADTIQLDTTILTTFIKNCGDNGTAENIDVKTTIYPSSGIAIEMSSVPINPDTLAQDSASLFGFTSGPLHRAIDSIIFIIDYKWEGERTLRSDTTVSRIECSTGCD